MNQACARNPWRDGMRSVNAFVFFSSADWSNRRRKLGVRRRVAILIRFPRRSYYWFLSWLVRKLTYSRLAHCSIGVDGAVLDPSIRGNRFWPFQLYIRHYPTLLWAVAVPMEGTPDLDAYPPDVSKPAMPTVIRWLSLGRLHTDDCVCITSDVLRAGGVHIPERIVSPKQLFHWLTMRGYPHARLSPGISPEPALRGHPLHQQRPPDGAG